MIESGDQTVLQEIIALRRKLHTCPELSGEEYKTAQLIASELEEMTPDLLVKNLGGAGVAAVFQGKAAGPNVLFRAELDALPIEEVNDFDYRSRHDNISHKCGHDGHMAILLGLARRVAASRPSRGSVTVLFQPAEETGAGAMAVLRDPQFDQIHPDYVFALHNLPGYPMGVVVSREGAFTADVRSLIIRLQGMTSHAAEPEHGINPALAIAELLQLSGRLTCADENSPDFSIVTPVHVVMGEKAYGVSAGYGEVHLTIRCWTRDVMEKLSERLLRMTDNIACQHELEIDTEWTNVFYANHNDLEAVYTIREVVKESGLSMMEKKHPLKWGEDFGAFTQRFKGAMFGLGAGTNTPALHNPDYDFPDEIIETGISIFYRIAMRILG
jgi:amidohydrolase